MKLFGTHVSSASRALRYLYTTFVIASGPIDKTPSDPDMTTGVE